MPKYDRATIDSADVLLDAAAGPLFSGRIAYDTNATPGTNHLIMGANNKRCRLIFFSDPAGSYWLANNPMTGTAQGIQIGSNTGPHVLTVELVGEMLTQDWYAVGASNSVIPSWIEVIQPL